MGVNLFFQKLKLQIDEFRNHFAQDGINDRNDFLLRIFEFLFNQTIHDLRVFRRKILFQIIKMLFNYWIYSTRKQGFIVQNPLQFRQGMPVFFEQNLSKLTHQKLFLRLR